MRVAIPLFGSRVSPRFGFASDILIAEVSQGEVVEERVLPTAGLLPQEVAMLLSSQRVKMVICGGISGFCRNLLSVRGIDVSCGIVGEARDALSTAAAGTLERNAHGRRRCRNRRGKPPWCTG